MTYISREAAIRLAEDGELCAGLYCDRRSENFYKKMKRYILSIPSADVRPVAKARWEDETGYIFNQLAQRVYCPVCKSYAYFYPITAKNFCPNCGADMREKAE